MRRLLLCRVPAWVFWMMFVVQSGTNEDDVWNADSGASCHRKHDRARIYNVRPPPPGRETITIGDRRRIRVIIIIIITLILFA